MKRPLRAFTPLAALLLVFGACAAPRQAAPTATVPGTAAASATPNFEGKTLNIVTGGTGGVYIVYGAGLADLLNKKLKVAASPQSTTASVDNMKLIRDGKADLAFVLADTAYDAVNGKGSFATEAKADAKSLAVLYSNFTHVIVRDDSAIKTIADLKGKRVSMGAAGSGTEIIGNRTLEAYGLDPAKDIQRERLGVADSASGLKDNKIDAFFWSGGLPTAAVTDLASTTKIRVLEQTDGIKKMADKYGPFYFNATIPKGTYGLAADVTVSGVANLLVVNSKFDAAFAQAIVRTMFDSVSELGTIHAEGKNLKLETAVNGSPLDYHQGAIDFYKSKGVWTK
ncbi:MAG: TAXI family TRAP transporter solute-binding subunit [Chloroflexota bacterium]